MSPYVEHFTEDYDWCTEINIHRKDASMASEYVLGLDSLIWTAMIAGTGFYGDIFHEVIVFSRIIPTKQKTCLHISR